MSPEVYSEVVSVEAAFRPDGLDRRAEPRSDSDGCARGASVEPCPLTPASRGRQENSK